MNFTTSAPSLPPTEAPQNGHSAVYVFPESKKHASGEKVFYLRLFWDQRSFLLRFAFYALLASTLLAFILPPRYKAKAELMPPDGQQGLGGALMTALSSKGAGGALGGLAGDLLGSKNSGALFVGVLNSRSVADKLIQQFDLQHLYHAAKMEDARDDLESHSDITEDRKSGILTIAVTDHSPQRAAAMTQAYITELDRLISQVSTSSARRERIFLEGRLHEVKADMDVAAKKFSDFASKNTALDIPAQGRAMMDAAAGLQGQVIAAESELSGLQQIYADSNVRVRSLKARITELHAELEKMAGDAENPSNGEGLMAPPIRKLPLLGITYADLFRQNKIEETVFELLTQQYEMAKVQEAKEIPTVKILDPPILPTKRLFPGPVALIIIGTLLGLAAGAAWLFLRKKWQDGDPSLPGRLLAQDITASFLATTRRFTPAHAAASRNLTRDSA